MSPLDVPQAFSHFSYIHSGRKALVCDLQGVYEEAARPGPRFDLTDPVIHYSSSRGRSRVYGRTDRGRAGIHRFFETHCCNDLCRLLRLDRAGLPAGAAGPG